MATPDGLRNRFDVDAEAYTSMFNRDNNPSFHENNVRFGGPDVPKPSPTGILTSPYLTIGLIVGTAFGVISSAYLWWYYNTTLVPFFDTTLTTILVAITNFTLQFTYTNENITNIQYALNVSGINPNGMISSDRVLYDGFIPFYSQNVTTTTDALDDTSVRLYDNVLSFSLTPSRFPTVTFPTDQITVDEDVGRRLRILETSTVPATDVTYTGTTPIYSVNVTNADAALTDTATRFYDNVLSLSLTPIRFPAVTFPTDQITVDEDVGRRLILLESLAFPTQYTDINVARLGSPTIGVSSCQFSVDFSSGVPYTKGPSLFASGGGVLTYNGSSPQGFIFTYGAGHLISTSVYTAPYINVITFIQLNGGTYETRFDRYLVVAGSDIFTSQIEIPIFFNPSDYLSMFFLISIPSGSVTFSDCDISPSANPYYQLKQFS